MGPSILRLCVFVAVVTALPSRCLGTIGGYTDMQTDCSLGYMKCTSEMGSGAMMYELNLIKNGSGI
jgi:hypothetical protein